MTLEHGIAVLLALGIGLSLGVIGSGGSILTLPILVYLVGVPPQAAVGMAMLIVGTTSAVGSYLHYRRGHFHAEAAVLVGSAGVVGAYLGAHLTRLVPQSSLMLIFAGLMLVVGLAILRSPAGLHRGERWHRVRCLGIGVGVGVLTGFLGVGGGFLIVPALVMFAGIDAKRAVGTSLAIITVNSAGGLLGQLRYASPDWLVALTILLPALVGMWMGVGLAARVSRDQLRVVFAWSIIIVGVGIIAASV